MSVDLSNFDPNSVGLASNNIFGLPFEENDAALVLLPVPWEVTVSYRNGTARGPERIFDASMQIDLYDADVKDGWKKGFYMRPINLEILEKSDRLRKTAEQIIEFQIEGGDVESNETIQNQLKEVNQGSQWLLDQVYESSLALLKQGKKVGLIGGDHSTPLGFIKALAAVHGSFGVLQIDAHADLRKAYEGFTYSHASIMYNVLEMIPEVSKLVQVGIRDYCEEEKLYIDQNPERIRTWFDQEIKEKQFEGSSWQQICQQIINDLPEKVYISFDIDGLDPKLCPNTGTPVPGGFEAAQVNYLIKQLHASGRQLIGFDLNEVSVGEENVETIDSIVGARMLFKLCNYMVA